MDLDRLPYIVGLVFAIVVGSIAVSQADSLRDLAAPLTTGSFRTLVDTTWFLMSMLVVVVVLGTLTAVVVMVLGKGR